MSVSILTSTMRWSLLWSCELNSLGQHAVVCFLSDGTRLFVCVNLLIDDAYATACEVGDLTNLSQRERHRAKRKAKLLARQSSSGIDSNTSRLAEL